MALVLPKVNTLVSTNDFMTLLATFHDFCSCHSASKSRPQKNDNGRFGGSNPSSY